MEATSKKIVCTIASGRFRRGGKAIFKEPIFKAHASLDDKINFASLLSLTQTRFQRSPYDKAHHATLLDSCLCV